MLDFIREHGILGSLFRLIGVLWHHLFRIILIGAVFRFVWTILFGQRSHKRRNRSEEQSETPDTQP